MGDPTDIVERLREALAAVQNFRGDLDSDDFNDAYAGLRFQAARAAPVLLAEIDRLRAALAQPAAPGWQPIETAPKDGTTVLVAPGLWTGSTCSLASYDEDKYAKKPRPYWSRADDFGRKTYSRDKPPTHWMPLPAAPQAPQPGGQGA